MKKIKFLLFSLFCLSSCNVSNDKALKIIVPTGAPAIAFYDFIKEDYFFTTSTPTNIVAEMNEDNDKSVVVLPTQTGISAIRNGAPFKLAATITFGNFYLVSLNNDEDKILNNNDKVVIFQRNQISDKLFNYLYPNNSFNLIYVENASDSSSIVKNGKMLDGTLPNYVLCAEPSLTNALENNENAYIYENFQDKFKEKSNDKLITQASVFVKKNLNYETVNNFLERLKLSLEKGIENPTLIKESLKSFSNNENEISQHFGINSILLEKSFNKGNVLGLGFKKSFEIKSDIDFFLNLLIENYGGTDEEIYFK